jgi:DNA-binding NarL/FixJ family response regulator
MRRQLLYDANTRQQLTPRETTVLSAAKKYKPVDDIANALHIPQTIVLRHLSNIINKLNNSDQKLAHQLVYAYKIHTND